MELLRVPKQICFHGSHPPCLSRVHNFDPIYRLASNKNRHIAPIIAFSLASALTTSYPTIDPSCLRHVHPLAHTCIRAERIYEILKREKKIALFLKLCGTRSFFIPYPPTYICIYILSHTTIQYLTTFRSPERVPRFANERLDPRACAFLTAAGDYRACGALDVYNTRSNLLCLLPLLPTSFPRSSLEA